MRASTPSRFHSTVGTAARAAVTVVLAVAVAASVTATAHADDDVGSTTQPIVGGTPAAGADYPFVGALLRNGGPMCTASLIRPQWALTAAHCVTDGEGRLSTPATSYEVALGADNAFGSATETIAAERIVVHPDFDRAKPSYAPANLEDGRLVPAGTPDGFLDYDVALIRLVQPSTITPVALATSADELDVAGEEATLVGYGRPCGKQSSDCSYDGTLREGPSTVLAASEAERILNHGACFPAGCAVEWGYVDAYMVAVNGGASSCKGDSGGPALARAADGTWRQIGVTSWGVGRDTRFLWWGSLNVCDGSKPSVYARVASGPLRSWIETVATEPTPVTVDFERARVALDGPAELHDADSVDDPSMQLRLRSVGTYHPARDQARVDIPDDWGDGSWVSLGGERLTIDVFEGNRFTMGAGTTVPYVLPPEPPSHCPPTTPGGVGGVGGVGGGGVGGGAGIDPGCVPVGGGKPIPAQQLSMNADEELGLDAANGTRTIAFDGTLGRLEVEVRLTVGEPCLTCRHPTLDRGGAGEVARADTGSANPSAPVGRAGVRPGVSRLAS